MKELNTRQQLLESMASNLDRIDAKLEKVESILRDWHEKENSNDILKETDKQLLKEIKELTQNLKIYKPE